MNPNELISNIPRMHTALAEWATCVVCIILLSKRFKNKYLTTLLCGCFLIAFCGWHYIAGKLHIYLWIPGMMTAVGLMFGFVLTLTKARIRETIFWTAHMFILAEFAASFEWQFYSFTAKQSSFANNLFVEYAFVAVIYAAIFSSVFFVLKRYTKYSHINHISKRDVNITVIIVALIFFISNVSFISPYTPISGRYENEIFYIRTLVNLCGLLLIFALQEQRLWINTKTELGAMQNLLSYQFEQYRSSKNNIEFLNQRYHDLKHQIDIIKSEENPQKKAEYFEQMEKAIKRFELNIDTGNEVLNILLRAKQIVCIENNINFTCVADGTLLNFMDAMDLCSIVGNALDNAIESVIQLDDIDKRLIKMALYSQGDLILFRFENYFEKNLTFENGLPLTTKSRPDNHGYGIKSIRSAVERYEGSISIDIKDNWFILCTLIPKNTSY